MSSFGAAAPMILFGVLDLFALAGPADGPPIPRSNTPRLFVGSRSDRWDGGVDPYLGVLPNYTSCDPPSFDLKSAIGFKSIRNVEDV